MKTKHAIPSLSLSDEGFDTCLDDLWSWPHQQRPHALIKRAYAEVSARI
jgi:hypothetical protein